MNSLTTINTQEVESITKNFSADTGLTYTSKNLKTVEDCIDQYNKADEVSHLAQAVIKDRMQGDALLKAKKIICDDEWNSVQLTDRVSAKWKAFLQTLELIDKRGDAKRNVRYLLDFAGYKEAGGKIETASHYREAKKVSETKQVDEIDAIYDDAGGENLATAKEVKEAVIKTKVWVQPLFEKEVGKEPKVELSAMSYGMKLNEAMPMPTESEWKSFYRKVASCIHPDKGGDENMTAILTQMNEMYQIVFSHNKQIQVRKDWAADYKLWKLDRNYQDDFINKEDL